MCIIQSSEKSRFNLWPHFFLVTLLHAPQAFRDWYAFLRYFAGFSNRILLDIWKIACVICAGIRKKTENDTKLCRAHDIFVSNLSKPNKKMSQWHVTNWTEWPVFPIISLLSSLSLMVFMYIVEWMCVCEQCYKTVK